MKASIKWLKEYVDFSLSAKELSHLLTMAGLEVEGTEEIGDDAILEIGVTPNRPDCLSIRGIAREISANLGIPLKKTPASIKKEEGDGPEIAIEEPELCTRYASRIICGVKPAPSPEWIVKRLEAHGFRSSLNIVDITNYVLLEMGHPLHAFDLDRLAGKKIAVSLAGSVKEFQTLDEEKRVLNNDTLMIWDAEKPVAIAGIMGGLNSEVTSSTVNVLLESAYFKPDSIRRSAKRLGITTESSYRFERGADVDGLTDALDMAAQMIAEIAGGTLTKMSDNYPKRYSPQEIFVRHERINSLLGVAIDKTSALRFLDTLGFKCRNEEQGILVTPPGFRPDIQGEVDIIEEIARLYSYDNIPSTLPVIKMQTMPDSTKRVVINNIKNFMIKSGYSEAINLSFLNPASLDNLNISVDDKRRKLVYIKNPLRKEDAALRTSLVPSLLDNVSLNMSRGERALSLFEISRIFFASGEKSPDEVLQMAAVYCKDMSDTLWQKKHEGFYDLKGVMENLFKELKTESYSFESNISYCEPYLHPGKSSSVKIDGEVIGSIGALHPGVAEKLGLTGDISLLEIYDLKRLLSAMPAKIKFIPLPKYPYVERDLAIIVSKDVTVAKAKEIIAGIDSHIIESVKLFDIYTGKPVPPDKKSLAFSIRYRASDRTLTDTEVDALHSDILRELERSINAELRS
ncbi:MAG: phenylalanine--tRNA ligase subunit beta [Nitrospirota bacterium]